MKQNRVPKRLWLHLEHTSIGMSGCSAEATRALGLTAWEDPEIFIEEMEKQKGLPCACEDT